MKALEMSSSQHISCYCNRMSETTYFIKEKFILTLDREAVKFKGVAVMSGWRVITWQSQKHRMASQWKVTLLCAVTSRSPEAISEEVSAQRTLYLYFLMRCPQQTLGDRGRFGPWGWRCSSVVEMCAQTAQGTRRPFLQSPCMLLAS